MIPRRPSARRRAHVRRVAEIALRRADEAVTLSSTPSTITAYRERAQAWRTLAGLTSDHTTRKALELASAHDETVAAVLAADPDTEGRQSHAGEINGPAWGERP